ncbi:hypothetical protein AAFF_G00059500 [Aldrovandia affinis]|uniref:Uncharacterized protein n=1 Tax=Aldrovandia affinis TaxID=143900 RepID=A0AAD7WDY2_9TELE|nr:hypothetical protein AAFF_G00059500 [Aldrovandia affinis]
MRDRDVFPAFDILSCGVKVVVREWEKVERTECHSGAAVLLSAVPVGGGFVDSILHLMSARNDETIKTNNKAIQTSIKAANISPVPLFPRMVFPYFLPAFRVSRFCLSPFNFLLSLTAGSRNASL